MPRKQYRPEPLAALDGLEQVGGRHPSSRRRNAPIGGLEVRRARGSRIGVGVAGEALGLGQAQRIGRGTWGLRRETKTTLIVLVRDEGRALRGATHASALPRSSDRRIVIDDRSAPPANAGALRRSLLVVRVGRFAPRRRPAFGPEAPGPFAAAASWLAPPPGLSKGVSTGTRPVHRPVFVMRAGV